MFIIRQLVGDLNWTDHRFRTQPYGFDTRAEAQEWADREKTAIQDWLGREPNEDHRSAVWKQWESERPEDPQMADYHVSYRIEEVIPYPKIQGL